VAIQKRMTGFRWICNKAEQPDNSIKTVNTMKKILFAISVISVAAAFVFATEESKTSATSSTEHRATKPADLKWAEAPSGLPAGGKMAVLNGDPTQTGPFTVRLKTPTGYKVMPHTHPTDERLTVISGIFRVGMGDKFDESTMQEMGPGSYIVMPSGTAHFAKGAKETIVQIDSEGPFQINYVNPADDPRNAKQ
jgi:quercetin dioxygenase-like cupin family protein